jgi:outer membrane protein TolC
MPTCSRSRQKHWLLIVSGLLLHAACLLFHLPPAAAENCREPAAAEGELSLQQALAMGLKRNLLLRFDALAIPITEAATVIEESRFDSALEASGSTGYDREPTTSVFVGDRFSIRRIYSGEAALLRSFPFGLSSRLAFGTERLTDNSPITGLRPQYRSFLLLDLNQPLLRDFGSDINTAGLRIARQRREQVAFDFLAHAQELGEEIESRYYDLSRAMAVIDFRRESLALAGEMRRLNQERLDAGLIPITEVQEAETAEASRREELVLARQEVQTSYNLLRDLLEITGDSQAAPADFRVAPLPAPVRSQPDLKQALAEAFANRPDLERERLEISSRNINLQFYKNQKLPRLDLDATLGVNGLSGEERQVQFAGIEGRPGFSGDYLDSIDRMASGDGYQWFAGLRFSYPLGNRAAEARCRQAALQKRQAIYRLQRLENGIVTEVRNGLVEVENSLERLEVTEKLEDLAAITLEQEMERLRHGLSDTFRILDFQEGVINARIRRIAALANFHRGLARLYRAMGLNLQRHDILPRSVTAEESRYPAFNQPTEERGN